METVAAVEVGVEMGPGELTVAAADDIVTGEGMGISVVAVVGCEGDWKKSPVLTEVVVGSRLEADGIVVSACWA